VANLGLLATIDYDTGRVERTQFVGFGLRSVAFDKLRRRIYVADFLGGNVLSIDVDSGAEVGRWFVGHYIRELQVSRDHSRLLTTSNLGIVRINLD
jgi:DNA-binding beta-propeller fold protein YncE